MADVNGSKRAWGCFWGGGQELGRFFFDHNQLYAGPC